MLAWIVGFVVLVLTRRLASGDAPLDPWDRIVLSAAAILGGLGGAKLLYWLTDPLQTLATLDEPALLIGGKTVIGGLLGAQLAVELAKKVQGVRRSTGDVYVPSLLVGLVLGRLGCFFSGVTDGTHGIATDSVLGMDLGDGVLRHPTALHEIAFLVGLGGLLALYPRLAGDRALPGDRFALFMVAYLGWRLLAEALKTQPVWPLGLSTLQLACVLGLLAYAAFLPRRLRRGSSATVRRGGA